MKLRRSHRRTFVSKYPTSPRSQEEDKIRQHAKMFMRLPVYLMNEKDEFGHSLLTYLSSHKYQSKHQGSEKHTKLYKTLVCTFRSNS
jgi:hypothetical protein